MSSSLLYEALGTSWNISQKGLEKVTENGSITDKRAILKNALDSDLKEIGSGVLTREQSKFELSDTVLQIQKIRNIAAPKANENSQAAPRMLKLTLTDGESYIQAVEITPLNDISREKTAPGTKILIIAAKIRSGFLILKPNTYRLLGGNVQHLYDKWEAAKNVQFSQNRNKNVCTDGGPPAWVNFGCKIDRSIENDENFKSLEMEKIKDNSEFDLQRKEAIAEASSGAVRKVFGGSVKQIVQTSQNNKHIRNYKETNRKGKSKSLFNEDEERPSKPVEKVSLFAFLEDKLPVSETIPPSMPLDNSYNNDKPYYQNRNNSKQFTYHKYDNKSNYSNKFYPEPVQRKSHGQNSSITNKNQQNSDVNNLAKDFTNKLNFNSQFINKTFKQNLNINSSASKNVQNENNSIIWNWKIGDNCLAKYWEDGKYYDATIVTITDKTCVVKFIGYGNIEEVLKVDCLPVTESKENNNGTGRKNNKSIEFKRNAGKEGRK